MYVASRGQNGWTTRDVGIPGYQSIGQSSAPGGEYGFEDTWKGTPTDKDMNRYLVWDRAQGALILGGTLQGTYAPYVFDNEGNVVDRLPTNLEDIPGSDTDMTEGGFMGSARITPDFSHYAFSATKVAFAPGGVLDPPGSAYDNDIGSDTVTLISKTEAGDNIQRDVTAGVSEEFIRIPAISDDGSHILMTTAAPGGRKHLYMRVNNIASYDISVDEAAVNQGVQFEGMTSDGESVYFTTDKKMIASDTDTSVDLYVWSAANDTLTRVSDSGNLPGNTDGCSAGWTSKCSVEVVPSPSIVSDDTSLASQSGDIYFYSPELLDGARGFPNKRNLYVYRNGQARHVATLEAGAPATRMNVSPDGAHTAFISATRLTSYDNTGFAEMYTYDPFARTIKCVSCVPNGDPPTYDVEGSQNGRFMTNDGRAFFTSEDSLVAGRHRRSSTSTSSSTAGRS